MNQQRITQQRIRGHISKALGLVMLPVFFVLGNTPVLAQEQSIGTLFTTPEQREYLDYLRREFVARSQLNNFNIQDDVVPDIPVEEAAPDTAPEIVEYRFGGIMVRLNGNRLVWLNGRQVAENSLPGNTSLVQSAGSTMLQIRHNGTRYLLKPGQTFNSQTGRVQDSYQVQQSPAATDDPSQEQTEPREETTASENPDQVLTAAATDNTEAATPEGTGNPDIDFETVMRELNEQRDTMEPEVFNSLENAFRELEAENTQ